MRFRGASMSVPRTIYMRTVCRFRSQGKIMRHVDLSPCIHPWIGPLAALRGPSANVACSVLVRLSAAFLSPSRSYAFPFFNAASTIATRAPQSFRWQRSWRLCRVGLTESRWQLSTHSDIIDTRTRFSWYTNVDRSLFVVLGVPRSFSACSNGVHNGEWRGD